MKTIALCITLAEGKGGDLDKAGVLPSLCEDGCRQTLTLVLAAGLEEAVQRHKGCVSVGRCLRWAQRCCDGAMQHPNQLSAVIIQQDSTSLLEHHHALSFWEALFLLCGCLSSF